MSMISQGCKVWEEAEDGTQQATDRTRAVDRLVRELVSDLESEDPKVADLSVLILLDRLNDPPYCDDPYELLGASVEERQLSEDNVAQIMALSKRVWPRVSVLDNEAAHHAVFIAASELNYWQRKSAEAGIVHKRLHSVSAPLGTIRMAQTYQKKGVSSE
jgi:hypothetical protein